MSLSVWLLFNAFYESGADTSKQIESFKFLISCQPILFFCYKQSNCGDTICSESSEKIIIRRSTQEQFHSEFYRMFILSVRFKKKQI